MNNLKNKKILVGITGSIAAYKAADLVSKLIECGSHVKVVMTKSSTSFITEKTLECISKNKVFIDECENDNKFLHLDLSKWADIILIAPCTANTFNKVTNGYGDDLLSTTCLAYTDTIYLAPAMNPQMWKNKILQDNLQKLSKEKFKIIGPDFGKHACGDIGYGRLINPALIVEYLGHSVQGKLLNGYQILVTAGPTREPIDPVRFISNYSSGKMGYAIASEAVDMGASVTLISGPVKLDQPDGVDLINVETSKEMYLEVTKNIKRFDILISAAAISDYVPEKILKQKHKNKDGDLTINFKRGIDIIKDSKTKNKNIFAVGFAAETEALIDNAKEKLKNKKIDMIIANEANHEKGLGFESNKNKIIIIDNQKIFKSNTDLKTNLAKSILHRIYEIVHKNIIKIKNA